MTPICTAEVIAPVCYHTCNSTILSKLEMESDLQYRIRYQICHGHLLLFRLAPDYSHGTKVATRHCLAASNSYSRMNHMHKGSFYKMSQTRDFECHVLGT